MTHSAENDVPGLIDRIAEVLNVHRWKSMGVRSVECECGKVISQGAEVPTMEGFPADEAFRRHIAAEVTRLIPPAGRTITPTVGIRPDCPTCTWPNRETVNMVCQTCGFDYGTTTTGEVTRVVPPEETKP